MAESKTITDEKLKEYYNDPKIGFSGINDFQRKLRERNYRVSQSKIKDFLATQDGYTQHKPVRKQFTTRRFYSPGIDAIWQADLAYFTDFPESNDSYIYWLVVVDTFSKFCWLVALTSKTMNETSKAFEHILKTSGRKCASLNTDNGTEFKGNIFQNMLKKHDIHWYGTHNEGKAMICERLIGTFKRKIAHFLTANKTKRWIDSFEDIVYNYNYNSVHNSTKFKPIDASKKENETAVYVRLYKDKAKVPREPSFKLGDTVRISKFSGAFTKSFTPNFTEEIFTIHEICKTRDGRLTIPITYKIRDYNNEIIQGTFYEPEMVKYNKQEEEYEIESVIQKKNNKWFVKWKGYPSSFNSWVDSASVKSIG